MGGKKVWSGYAALFVFILGVVAVILLSPQGRTQQRQPDFDEGAAEM